MKPFEASVLFNSTANGRVQCFVIRPSDGPRITALARAGDVSAIRIARSAGAWAANIFTALPEKPRCLCCNVEFKDQEDAAVLACTVPFDAERGRGWATVAGICGSCADGAVVSKAIEAWKRAWPEATVIPNIN